MLVRSLGAQLSKERRTLAFAKAVADEPPPPGLLPQQPRLDERIAWDAGRLGEPRRHRGRVERQPEHRQARIVRRGHPPRKKIARAAEAAGADAIVAGNTMPVRALDDSGAPLLGAGPHGGLSGRALHPIALRLVAEIAIAVSVAAHHQQLRHDVFVPVLNEWIPLGWGWYVLVFFIIAGAANAVNLTDGLDGLASGTSIIALFTLTAMAVTIYIRSGPAGERIGTRLDAAFVGAAIIGAAIGFLWFNAFPAEVFMGDTGSFALGGAIAGFAIVTGTEILLLLIAGIFVIEVLSLIIQVVSFKRTGRRVFLIAPIHHHFEMKAWSETKIMVRFWIVCAILCATGFALFYRDFLQFGQ